VPVKRRSLPAVLGAAVLALVLTACGAGGDGSGGTPGAAPTGDQPAAPAVQRDDALAALVPAAVASDGRLVVGTDATYAPNEFVAEDGVTIIGLDVDLGTAIAQKLGLEAEFQNSSFDGILPGIAAARYELGMSSFTDNAEREQVVDMVTYFSAGTKMATPAGNPENVALDDLCGRTVAVQRGTVQVEDLTTRDAQCTQQGRPAITISQFQAQTDVLLALTAGRAQAMLADSPVVDYAVQQTNGQIEVVGEAYDTAPYGIAVPKGQGRYAQAVQGAVQALIDDGTYAAILEKWGVATGAIPTSEINAAS
jgi:polar amino acid transport system substrate-binding protein